MQRKIILTKYRACALLNVWCHLYFTFFRWRFSHDATDREIAPLLACLIICIISSEIRFSWLCAITDMETAHYQGSLQGAIMAAFLNSFPLISL